MKKMNGTAPQQKKLTTEQLTQSLAAIHDIANGAPSSRVLEYANDGRLQIGKAVIANILSGELVLVPKANIRQQQEQPNRARRRAEKPAAGGKRQEG